MALENKDISTGKDFSLQLTDGSGNILSSVRLTDFDVKVDYYSPESDSLDGLTRRESIVKGYTVSIKAERTNNFFDQYIAAQQANFLLGGVQVYLTGTETIQERNGSTSQYLYEKADLQITDLGTRKITEFTMISGNFFASVRTPAPL